jgi:hypothetical protein
MGRAKKTKTTTQEKIMNLILTLLPLGLVAANYLVADLRDRRRPNHDAICG